MPTKKDLKKQRVRAAEKVKKEYEELHFWDGAKDIPKEPNYRRFRHDHPRGRLFSVRTGVPTNLETQAARVIEKFGSVPRLVWALNASAKYLDKNAKEVARFKLDPDFSIHRTTVYRWLWQGFIPGRLIPRIRYAARFYGVLLTEEDLALELPVGALTRSEIERK